MWDAANNKPLHKVHQERKGPIYGLAVSPDGKTVATGDVYCKICLWDVTTGKEIRTLQGHTGNVTALIFSPDSQILISRGSDQTIRFWELASGKELQKWSVGHVNGLALSGDGKMLALAVSDGFIRLYEVATGKELRQLPGHQVPLYETDGRVSGYHGNVVAVAFSPDGQSLVSAGGILDCTICLWDVATGKERLRLRAHEGQKDIRKMAWEFGEIKKGVNWVTFSPDGKMLASGGSDNNVILWDVATGKEIGRFEGHKGSVFCVAFSPDGKTLASASADKTVLLWDTSVRIKDGQLPPVHLEPKEVATRWTDLAAPKILQASQAYWSLAAAPKQSMPFLKERLRPIPHPDAKRIAQLLLDLDSDQFKVREKAAQELAELGEVAKPALWHARRFPPSIEVGSRVEQILQKQREAPVPPEKVRQLRAVKLLEHYNTPETREMLEQLAKGAPGADLTREAKASLERLTKQFPSKP